MTESGTFETCGLYRAMSALEVTRKTFAQAEFQIVNPRDLQLRLK
jgi:hypothetical protein